MSAFKPSASGWPFANAFDHPAEHLGLSGKIAPGFGLCGGMCWSALDRYMSGIPIPRDTEAPSAGEPLHAELVRRQANVLAHGVWDRLRAWHELPDEGRTLGGDGVADLTRKEWTRIRTLLDERVPVLLCPVVSRGIYADLTTGHQVLAYGYDEIGDRIELHVYDPNQPGNDDLRFIFHLGRKGSPLDALLPDGRPARGFFSVPYDRRRAPEFAGDRFDDRARIGLNRPVGGRPCVLAGSGGRLDLFVAGPDRTLLHFQRKPGQHWVGTNLTAEDRIGADYAVHGDPVAVGLAGKRMSVFVRGEFGDLLHYQWKLRWSAENLTDKRKAGPRYRIQSEPVVLDEAGLRLSVFGRSDAGHLIHYGWAPVQGWSADDITENSRSRDPLTITGRPAALLGPDGAHHVIGRSETGAVVHFVRLPGEHWDAENVTAGLPDDGLEILDDPVTYRGGSAVEAYGRNEAGTVLVYRWMASDGWQAMRLPEVDGTGAAGPLSLAAAAGERHLFARGERGELLHWYLDAGRWVAEDVTARAHIGANLPFDGPPHALITEAGSIYVLARSGRDVALYRWTSRGDWEADLLTRREGFGPDYRVDEPLTVVLDTLDAPHVLSANRKGTLLHFEMVTEARPIGARPDEPEPVQEPAEEPEVEAEVVEASALPEAAGGDTRDAVEAPGPAEAPEPAEEVDEEETITLSAEALLAEEEEETAEDAEATQPPKPEKRPPQAEPSAAASRSSIAQRRPASLDGLPLLEDPLWDGPADEAEDAEEEDADAFGLPLLFDPDADAVNAAQAAADGREPEAEAEPDPLAFLDELPGGDPVIEEEDEEGVDGEPATAAESVDEPPLARLGDLQILADAVDEARGTLERIDDVEILPELMLEPDAPVPPEPTEEPQETMGPAPHRPYDHAYADVVPDDLAYSYDLPDDLGLQVPEDTLRYLSTQAGDDSDDGPGRNGTELAKEPDYMEHPTSEWRPAPEPGGASPLPYLGELRDLSGEGVDTTNPTRRDLDGEGYRPPPPLLQMRDFEKDG